MYISSTSSQPIYMNVQFESVAITSDKHHYSPILIVRYGDDASPLYKDDIICELVGNFIKKLKRREDNAQRAVQSVKTPHGY